MMRLTPVLRPFAQAAGHLFALWLRTLRVRVILADGTVISRRAFEAGEAIFAVSERDLLAVLPMVIGRTGHVLIAEGNDGDWAAALVAPLRCRIVRGSSLHDGLRALRVFIRSLNESEHPALIVVDGPLGPVGEVKEGIVACAAHTRRPVVPAATAAAARVVFRKSWAKHFLPLPWARVIIAVGPFVRVEEGASREQIRAHARFLSEEIQRLRGVAETRVA